MVLTEKERRIVNALIEEELGCTMQCAEAKDSAIENYSHSLATIMRKLNEKSFRTPHNKCFYFINREMTSQQFL